MCVRYYSPSKIINVNKQSFSSYQSTLVVEVRSLQGNRSIATIIIATDIFRCNKTRCYHKTEIHGNRLHILPRFHFVVISSPFVAIGATYCHKLHPCCNMAVLLRQLRRVAGNHHFVAIESGYCNRVELCGDIRNHIATILACGGSYGYCCNKWIPIATKYVLVVIGRICLKVIALRQNMHPW